MKFTDGAWLVKNGIRINKANSVRFADVDNDILTITVPAYHISGRNDTLGGVFITVRISSPLENVFHIRAYHHKGDKTLEPSYYAAADQKIPLKISDDGKEIEVISGESRLIIGKEDYSLTLMRGGRRITASEGGALAYINDGNTDQNYMREQLSLKVGEHVYGLGERFGAFIKNGQTVDIINKDGGTFSEQAYKNVPFYITDNDLGVFVNHTEEVNFEVASEHVSKVQFSVKGECLDYYLIAGSSMKDVLSVYTKLTGRAPLLPEWSYGLWLSTSFTTDYDEKTVLSFIDGMKDSHWCNFLWDKDMFPDPEGLIRKIHDRGLKVCVWINPYIAQMSELFDEAQQQGYLIRKTDGSVWQTDLWQPGMGIVDFTNPGAKKWYQDKLAALLDMGVDCFKTDFGERIPTEGVMYSGGQDPLRMHNYYTYLYNETVFDLLLRAKGEGQAVLFARSATAGSQKFPVHWGGDCRSDYVSMEQTIRGGLSLMMSGFSYWSHDIGGFEDKSTADVYKRWAAFGLMSSHSRLHGSSSYRVPWNYDEEAVEVVRYYTELKKKLLPYFLEASEQAHDEGIPVMRPMVLEFEDDPVCAFLDKQYMIGDDLLAAPVFNEEGTAQFYLPAGIWEDVHTGQKVTVECGRFIKEHRDYLHMPLYRKMQ